MREMALMPPSSKDAKLQLGEPWAGKLADFCAAYLNAPQKEVIRAALDFYIDAELAANAGVKERYEKARQKRLSNGNIRSLKPIDD